MRLQTRLKAKLHHARITECNPDYIGSIAICPELMYRVDIQAGEQVHIWAVDKIDGERKPARIVTYAIPGEKGEISINGGGAHYFEEGQKIIIASFVQTDEERIVPAMLLLDEHNNAIKTLTLTDRRIDV